MPRLTRRKVIQQACGMRCDRCGKTDGDGLNDFFIGHTLGFDSPLDMGRVEAAICDACLVSILLDGVPGACFSDGQGRVLPHAAVREALAAYGARTGGGS
jgi:hypothetical protein